jgi:hypothetical protein
MDCNLEILTSVLVYSVQRIKMAYSALVAGDQAQLDLLGHASLPMEDFEAVRDAFAQLDDQVDAGEEYQAPLLKFSQTKCTAGLSATDQARFDRLIQFMSTTIRNNIVSLTPMNAMMAEQLATDRAIYADPALILSRVRFPF